MDLFLILKKKYFDQIESGKKTIEYRLVTPYWVKRLSGKQYDNIIFQLGYSNKRRIVKKHVKTEITNIKHEFFGDEEVPVFAIHLE